MVVECPECRALVNAVMLQSHLIHDDVAPTVEISFACCPRCQRPFLAQRSEDFDGWSSYEQIYPSLEIQLSERIPPAIREAYTEARKCYRADAFTACAVMCRKTLEGICAEHGHTERTLAESLQSMRDAGIIENRLFDWADALRISGNEAAHDVAVNVNAADATDVLDFTNALIEYIFTFRDRFEAFTARRQRVSQQHGTAGTGDG